MDVKIEMIRSLIPLGLMHVHELLDDEVKELAGERYARKDELERGRRHGTNPGTVGLAGQRVPIRVPRVRSQEGVEIPLRSYEALNDGGEVNDLLLKRVLYGISCRNYEAAAESPNTNEFKTGAPGRFDHHRPMASPRSEAYRRRCRRFGFPVLCQNSALLK